MAIGFWMNNKNCYGCKTCSIACKSEKQLDKGVLLRHVTAIRQDDPRAFAYLSMACNHCEEPACMANCPVGAYSKLEDGTVIQDHSVCIGCKTCISACPYGAPSYDEATSTTFKCDGCYDRRQRGELPACVVACPGANLALDDMESLQSTYTADIVSDENFGTKPNFVITVNAAPSSARTQERHEALPPLRFVPSPFGRRTSIVFPSLEEHHPTFGRIPHDRSYRLHCRFCIGHLSGCRGVA